MSADHVRPVGGEVVDIDVCRDDSEEAIRDRKGRKCREVTSSQSRVFELQIPRLTSRNDGESGLAGRNVEEGSCLLTCRNDRRCAP